MPWVAADAVHSSWPWPAGSLKQDGQVSLNPTVQSWGLQLVTGGVRCRNILYTKNSLGIQYKASVLNISLILEKIRQDHMFLIMYLLKDLFKNICFSDFLNIGRFSWEWGMIFLKNLRSYHPFFPHLSNQEKWGHLLSSFFLACFCAQRNSAHSSGA